MFTTHEDGVTQMSRLGGGGGSIGKTSKALVIGIWDKEAKMSNDKNQNGGDVAIAVDRLVKFMKLAGF